MNTIFFPPEWHKQSAIQLTWPHKGTDWADMLEEVLPCFVSIAKEVIKRESLVIVCENCVDVLAQLGEVNMKNLKLVQLKSDDTWARDHGSISVFKNGKPELYDFTFNGWGNKFSAVNDNKITAGLFLEKVFTNNVNYSGLKTFILEGGSIETDGKGILLTTEQCLLAPNRNQPMTRDEIELYLMTKLGISKVLWLQNGYLAGDDTDGHIDMLARFCDDKTIAYVCANDKNDEHTMALRKMEKELEGFTTLSGEHYKLIPLPMAKAVYYEGERLPASYANFLIINGAVLLPYYNTDLDLVAKMQLELAFPDREIIGIDCLPLIKQHGSLHCLTMQYPEGFIEI